MDTQSYSHEWSTFEAGDDRVLLELNEFSSSNIAFAHKGFDSTTTRQIRVLGLRPALHYHEPLIGFLEIRNLDEDLREDGSNSYEALSYAWSYDTGMKKIQINEQTFAVSGDLDLALRSLRRPRNVRKLWIDAICINQNDDLEKSSQVSQMRDVYANSSMVIIWLGPSTEETDASMGHLGTFRGSLGKDSEELLDFIRKTMDGEVLFRLTPGFWGIFGRRWWTRVWTVQEVFSATQDPLVLCGHKEICWRVVSQARRSFDIRMLSRHSRTIPSNIFDFMRHGSVQSTVSSRSNATWRDLTLLKALDATSDRIATDPRDKVFAVLGIVAGKHQSDMLPDYTLSTTEVFQNTMFTILEMEPDLTLLYNVMTQEKRSSPSWCLDFSKDRWNHPDVGSSSARTAYHNGHDSKASAGINKPSLSYNLSRRILFVRGNILGKIRIARPIPGQSNPFAPNVPSINGLRESISKFLGDVFAIMLSTRVALEHRLGFDGMYKAMANGIVWNTLVGGIGPEHPDSPWNQASKIYKKFDSSQLPKNYAIIDKWVQQYTRKDPKGSLQEMEWEALLPEIPDDVACSAWIRWLLGRIAEACIGCCYFTTDTGYIGLAYHKIEERAVLSIVHGYGSPVILTPLDGGYHLTTYCYAPGLMDGEFFQEHEGHVARKDEYIALV